MRACTRGHEGSITSVHANSLEDVPETITDMCMLDGRGMNPITMTRRITEQVTHIGMEMRMLGGDRKLVRVGEYEWSTEGIKVRELVRFEEASGRWLFPEFFSNKASQRIFRLDPEGYRNIAAGKGGETC